MFTVGFDLPGSEFEYIKFDSDQTLLDADIVLYRLKPIADRPEFFTDKCISAAKRIGAALIRTPDLFAPARYIVEHQGDSEYAKKCREVIFSTAGAIVAFPELPIVRLLLWLELPKRKCR
jgi:hypothetical protein